MYQLYQYQFIYCLMIDISAEIRLRCDKYQKFQSKIHIKDKYTFVLIFFKSSDR